MDQLSTFSWTKTGWFERTPPFSWFYKRFHSRILFSSRRRNVALIRSASLQRSKVITEVNPIETDPSSAWCCKAEIQNCAGSKSDFPNMSLTKCPFTKNYKKIFHHSFDVSQSTTAQQWICCIFSPHHTETSIKYERKYISAVKHSPLVHPQSVLFRKAAFRCVQFQARLQINVMTSSCGSLSFI